MPSDYIPKHAGTRTPAGRAPHPVVNTTQSNYPWRAVLRTVFALLVAISGSWVVIVQTLGLHTTTPWVASATVVAAGITRILAMPAVEQFLQTNFPWLAAEPK